MIEPETAQWGLSISDADFEKLKAGFEAQDMDDKWTISLADLENGNKSITITRSWTGRKHYILDVKPRNGDSGVKIEAITWEQNKGGIYISEEQGKKEAVILCRGILDCHFEALPHYDDSLLWDHPTAGLDADYLAEKEKDRQLSLAKKESSSS